MQYLINRIGLVISYRIELAQQRLDGPLPGPGWTLGGAVLETDLTGVEIRRTGADRIISRGDTPLAIASASECWFFGPAGEYEFPTHFQQGFVRAVGPGSLFLDLYPKLPDPAGSTVSGCVAGRKTWVVSRNDTVFEFDQEFGALLAVQVPWLRIFATSFSVLDDPVHARWDGPIVPRDHDGNAIEPLDPAKIPGYLLELPPLADENAVRVFFSDVSLESQLPDFQIGDTISVPLHLRGGEDFPGLAQSVPAQVTCAGEQLEMGTLYFDCYSNFTTETRLEISGMYGIILHSYLPRTQYYFQRITAPKDSWRQPNSWYTRDFVVDATLTT